MSTGAWATGDGRGFEASKQPELHHTSRSQGRQDRPVAKRGHATWECWAGRSMGVGGFG